MAQYPLPNKINPHWIQLGMFLPAESKISKKKKWQKASSDVCRITMQKNN